MEDIVIAFEPLDESLTELIHATFAEETVLESNAFTGTEIITIILVTGKDTLLKVLSFFTKHRKSLKSTSVRIGAHEIELQGYSIKEVSEFISSGNVEKVLASMKNRK